MLFRSEAFYGGATFDGTLYKATLDDPTAELYLPPGVDGRGRPDGRTEAVGMNVDDEGRLYVSGGSSGNVYVYDIETRELVATLSTGPGGFINDVTIADNGDVYFTDSATSNPARHVIWRATEEQVEEGGGAPEAIPLAPEVPWQPGFNANGIRAVNDGGDDDEDEDDDDDG